MFSDMCTNIRVQVSIRTLLEYLSQSRIIYIKEIKRSMTLTVIFVTFRDETHILLHLTILNIQKIDFFPYILKSALRHKEIIALKQSDDTSPLNQVHATAMRSKKVFEYLKKNKRTIILSFCMYFTPRVIELTDLLQLKIARVESEFEFYRSFFE